MQQLALRPPFRWRSSGAGARVVGRLMRAASAVLRFGGSAEEPAGDVLATSPATSWEGAGGEPDASVHAQRADRVVEDVDREHGQQLLGLAIRSGLGHEAAEDAVQEALLRLWLEVRKGVDIIEPRAWAFRTLYRIAMDEHRYRRRVADITAQLSTRSWRAIDPDVAQRISIWGLVDQLPTRQRQVVYLRYKADLSFDQIAAVMSITASAARAHATFAAEKLRAAIGGAWSE
jgi:RNA polymerase sigma factor (sigma-70 family)